MRSQVLSEQGDRESIPELLCLAVCLCFVTQCYLPLWGCVYVPESIRWPRSAETTLAPGAATSNPHITVAQHWANAEPTSPMLVYHWVSAGRYRLGTLIVDVPQSECLQVKQFTNYKRWLYGNDFSFLNLATQHSQQTQDDESVLFERWSNVVDGGATLNQHCFNVLRLLD